VDVRLTIPDEMLEALGPDPERETLEGLLLLLVGEGRVSLERAGEVLGLENREQAERWYAERVSSRSSLDAGDLGGIQEPVHLEDLTQESLDRSDRFLRITPARRGSGFSDVSKEHDKYLYGEG
jgi:predicted HTH domain antitoxin